MVVALPLQGCAGGPRGQIIFAPTYVWAYRFHHETLTRYLTSRGGPWCMLSGAHVVGHRRISLRRLPPSLTTRRGRLWATAAIASPGGRYLLRRFRCVSTEIDSVATLKAG